MLRFKMGTVSDLSLKSWVIQRPGGIMCDHLLFLCSISCDITFITKSGTTACGSGTVVMCSLNMNTIFTKGKKLFDGKFFGHVNLKKVLILCLWRKKGLSQKRLELERNRPNLVITQGKRTYLQRKKMLLLLAVTILYKYMY